MVLTRRARHRLAPRPFGALAWLWALGLSIALWPRSAAAERETTRDAFDRLEEILEMREEDGLFDPRDVLPTILVSAQPRYEISEGWHQARALQALTRAFGEGTVRSCEACMRPRTQVEDGRLEQTAGPLSLDEITALDDRYRGDSAKAKTAVWLDETQSGIAIRIVDLRNGRVVFAQNVDPALREYAASEGSYRRAEELERRTRRESLTHAIVDLAVYPGQHVSFEWADQWGDTNANLTGVVVSAYDPVLGIGASYHRVLPWQNITVGTQAILSIPTVIVRTQTESNEDVIDPLFTAVGIVRWPLGRNSNYAALFSASTNGQFGLGLSFLNTSLIPVLP